jgi:hypothetical protein
MNSTNITNNNENVEVINENIDENENIDNNTTNENIEVINENIDNNTTNENKEVINENIDNNTTNENKEVINENIDNNITNNDENIDNNNIVKIKDNEDVKDNNNKIVESNDNKNIEDNLENNDNKNIEDNLENNDNKNIENHGKNNVEDNDEIFNNIDKQVIIDNKIISQKKNDLINKLNNLKNKKKINSDNDKNISLNKVINNNIDNITAVFKSKIITDHDRKKADYKYMFDKKFKKVIDDLYNYLIDYNNLYKIIPSSAINYIINLEKNSKDLLYFNIIINTKISSINKINIKKWMYIDQFGNNKGVYTTKEMRELLNNSQLPYLNRTKVKNIYWKKLNDYFPISFIYEKYEKAFLNEDNEIELFIKWKKRIYGDDFEYKPEQSGGYMKYIYRINYNFF